MLLFVVYYQVNTYSRIHNPGFGRTTEHTPANLRQMTIHELAVHSK